MEPQSGTTQWRDIPGYEGSYKISEHGQVKSLLMHTNGKAMGFLTPHINDKGYLAVGLSAGAPGKPFRVHSLVALAFLGPKPEGFSVNHIDGYKLNNHYSNLEYCTQGENVKHAHRMGLIMYPAKKMGPFPKPKHLNNEQITEIKKLSLQGESGVSIAKKFGVKPCTVSRIRRGLTQSSASITIG